MSYKFIDLFAGIGGFHQAACSTGGECVFASEIDHEAKRAYEINYNIIPHGDITQIDKSEIPDHDILFAGFVLDKIYSKVLSALNLCFPYIIGKV